MKTYPLDVCSVGEHEYIVMSKGHHDFKQFMDAVRESYDWPLGNPEHKYAKVVPSRGSNYNFIYVFVDKGTKGCFPVTYCWESYEGNSYD